MPPLDEKVTPDQSELPPHLLEVLASAPANVDRRTGAELISRHLFPVSHRSLEAWPLLTQHVNGKAITSTIKLFQIAYAKLSAAPMMMGGRRSGHRNTAGGSVALKQVAP
jgi:hypothetical protein